MSQSDRAEVVVLIPVYNDWDAVDPLIQGLDQAFESARIRARVLLVDDCSSEVPQHLLFSARLAVIEQVDVLVLSRNLGHQRAIAIGLSYVEHSFRGEYVVVMDGDGEDAPSDVPRLLAEAIAQKGRRIVFAGRARRSEGPLFMLLYHCYRLLHRFVTGISVRFGNFSVVPAPILKQLVVVSEMWNHYAAAVVKSRIPYSVVPTVRARRLAGQPKMDFVSLVVHGLSALAVHGETVGVRMLVLAVSTTAFIMSSVALLMAVRFWTELAIPGWTSTMAIVAGVLLVQIITLSGVFAFVSLSSRATASFIPTRDFRYFILRRYKVLENGQPCDVKESDFDLNAERAPHRRPRVGHRETHLMGDGPA